MRHFSLFFMACFLFTSTLAAAPLAVQKKRMSRDRLSQDEVGGGMGRWTMYSIHKVEAEGIDKGTMHRVILLNREEKTAYVTPEFSRLAKVQAATAVGYLPQAAKSLANGDKS